MHKWIYRDGCYECIRCGTTVEAVPFDGGHYPLECTRETVCRVPADDGRPQPHHVVVVPPSRDEEMHGECYHCARQF